MIAEISYCALLWPTSKVLAFFDTRFRYGTISFYYWDWHQNTSFKTTNSDTIVKLRNQGCNQHLWRSFKTLEHYDNHLIMLTHYQLRFPNGQTSSCFWTVYCWEIFVLQAPNSNIKSKLFIELLQGTVF
jgi:hypothetical protein